MKHHLTTTTTSSLLVVPVVVVVVVLLWSWGAHGQASIMTTIVGAGVPETEGYLGVLSQYYPFTGASVELSPTTHMLPSGAIAALQAGAVDAIFLSSRLPPTSSQAQTWSQLPVGLYALNLIACPGPNSANISTTDPTQITAIWNGQVTRWEDVSLGQWPSANGNITLVVLEYENPLDEFASYTGLFGRQLASLDTTVFGPAYAAHNSSLAQTVLHLNGPQRTVIVPSNASAAIGFKAVAEAVLSRQGSLSYAPQGLVLSNSNYTTTTTTTSSSSSSSITAGLSFMVSVLDGNGEPVSFTSPSLPDTLEQWLLSTTVADTSAGLLRLMAQQDVSSLVGWPFVGVIYAMVPTTSVSHRDGCSFIGDMLNLLGWSQSNAALYGLLQPTVPPAYSTALPLTVAHATTNGLQEVSCGQVKAASSSIIFGAGENTTLLNQWLTTYASSFSSSSSSSSSSSAGQSFGLNYIPDMYNAKQYVETHSVDFGLAPTQVAPCPDAANGYQCVPLTADSVVPTYNLPSLSGTNHTLAFSANTLGALLSSSVPFYWNDTLIQSDNPSLDPKRLPFVPVQFIADGGESAQSPLSLNAGPVYQILSAWINASMPGLYFNPQLTFEGGGAYATYYPLQNVGQVNAVTDVAFNVKATPYSLGFDYAYKITQTRTLPLGNLFASSGNNNNKRSTTQVISPTADSVTLSVNQSLTQQGLGALNNWVVSVGGGGGWPMASISYVYMPISRVSTDCSEFVAFLSWIYWTQSSSEAPGISGQQGSIPLGQLGPAAAANLATKSLMNFTCNGVPAFRLYPCLNSDGAICSSHGTCSLSSVSSSTSSSSSSQAACTCDGGWQGSVCNVSIQSQSSTSSSNTALGLGLGVGLGVGLLLLAAVCVLVAMYLTWVVAIRRLRNERPQWEVEHSDIQLMDEIGKGSYGSVHRGKWRGTEVAVKTLSLGFSRAEANTLNQLRREIDVMSRLRHPNVVLFMGACTKPPHLCLIMEFMPLGSLFDLFHNDLVPHLPFQLRLKLALDVGRGMHALHQSGVVHRDLKSPNILLDSKWNAKVADFGLSAPMRLRARAGHAAGSTGNGGQLECSVPWTAPEILMEDPNADPVLADVYSFGIILWEIITREPLYPGMSRAAIAVAVMRNQLRPVFRTASADGAQGEDQTLSSNELAPYLDASDERFREPLQSLLALAPRCWHDEPPMRPTYLEITNELASIQAKCDALSTEPQTVSTMSSSDSRENSHSSRTDSGSSGSAGTNSLHGLAYGHQMGQVHRNNSYRRRNRAIESMPPPPEGPLFIVFSDVVGAGRLWEALPLEMGVATKLHNGLLRRIMNKYTGYEAQLSADAAAGVNMGIGTFCIVFRNVFDGLGWCADVQRGLVNLDWPETLVRHEEDQRVGDRVLFRGLRVRMGASWGTPEAHCDERTRRAEYAGPIVRAAARLTVQATGGQVLLHKSVHVQLSTLAATISPQDVGVLHPLVKPRSVWNADAEDPTSGADVLVIAGLEERVKPAFSSSSSKKIRLVPSGDNLSADIKNDDEDDDPMTEASIGEVREREFLTSANMCSWFINYDEVRLGKELGRGSTAVVYEAKWKGSTVAVKLFHRASLREDQALSFRCEVAHLASVQHPNVVTFVGASLRRDVLALITELMPRGSLRQVLDNPSFGPQLKWQQRLRMARDVAAGMRYLHAREPPMLHRDLKSSNLLVDDAMVVKVSDFGFARIKEDHATMTRCGTPAWSSPEVLQGDRYDEKADVYSLGIVLWEILTLRHPYDDCNFMQVAIEVMEGKRPDIPRDCDQAYSKLLRKCWRAKPEHRPTMEEAFQSLNLMLDDDATPFTV